MILKRVKLNIGDAHITNCYIIKDEKSEEIMIVDPGGEPHKVIEMVRILGGHVKYIVLTHCHADHIGGVTEVKQALGGKILIHRDDVEGLYNSEISLPFVLGLNQIELEADSRLDDEDKIHIGDIEFRVIHTPGHTQGGICLYCEQENLVLSGDTLFRGTWGRTDLPTGSSKAIMQSITNKLLILPEDTIIYPGHGKSSMIKDEEPIYFNLQPRKE